MANQAPAQAGSLATGANAQTLQGPRITEVPDVAAIEVLSSAMGGVKVAKELVKYVDPAEVYAGERRRHSEILRATNFLLCKLLVIVKRHH